MIVIPSLQVLGSFSRCVREAMRWEAIFWFGLIATLSSALAAPAATHHLDSEAGDDGQDGATPATAWKSLKRANRQTYAAGDRVLFRAGCEWDGAFQPRGSGQKGKPIVVDQFGKGAKPAIHGRGLVPAVVRLENQSYWTVQNLEITNQSEFGERELRGVEIRARDVGLVKGIHLENLDIHDVNGISNYTDDGDALAKTYGGLATIIEGDVKPTAWDELRIENCTIRDVGPAGIAMITSWVAGHGDNNPQTWFPSRGVVLRGNKIERTARNGLIVRGCKAPLVERNFFKGCAHGGSGNACFAFHCDDALFQFNEACHTIYNPGDTDASGFDSDYYCRRSVFQYNYSHDNDYGFMLVCNRPPGGFNDGTIVRYNVSQNDGGNIFRISGATTRTQIYNNTIYASPTMTNPKEGDPPRIIYFKSWNNGWSDDFTFANNIVVNQSQQAVYVQGDSTNNRFRNNLFFGEHPESEPADPRRLTADPLLVDPGGAGEGIPTAIAAYSLRPGSPAIFAGRALPRHVKRDFAGRRVLMMNGRVDLGALAWRPKYNSNVDE